jgi:GNAT superfamily N-acetyltransferase
VSATIARLSADDFATNVDGLADLLAVAGGASLGFLAPLDHDAACDWWRALAAVVAGGSLAVWISRDAGRVTGTVSVVALERKANGRHRASVVRLIVHRGARGRGLGRRLRAAAKEAAASAGIALLILDTEASEKAPDVDPASPPGHRTRAYAGDRSRGRIPAAA